MPRTHDEPGREERELLSRRRALLLAALGGAAVAGAGLGSMLASDDDDDSSGHGEHGDSSGPGSGDDDDDDDSSGRGRGRGGDEDDDEADDDDVTIQGEVPAGSAEVLIVGDEADGFVPGTIIIDAGQAVTWVNGDDEAHTATGAGFDTDIMQPGTLATVTFDTPGSFPYACQIHPEMTGIVEVRGAAGTPGAATPEATPAATPAAGGDAVGVSIFNIAFDPQELTVPVGATVTWTNDDPVSHTATAEDGAFDSGVLEQGQTFSFTFDAAGTFTYICAFHPTMNGTITVTG